MSPRDDDAASKRASRIGQAPEYHNFIWKTNSISRTKLKHIVVESGLLAQLPDHTRG
jgi:hypothetical protein